MLGDIRAYVVLKRLACAQYFFICCDILVYILNFVVVDVQLELAEHTSKELEKSSTFFKDRLGLQFKTVSGQ